MKRRPFAFAGLARAMWGLAVVGAGFAPSPASAAELDIDNVVIVLDASGSMAGQMRHADSIKMDAAKTALKVVLSKIPQTTHIGLLVFSANNLTDEWVYPLGPRDNQALMAAIDRPQPGHGTPLGKYIKIGADRLLQQRAKQLGYGTFRLLIVTDGIAHDQDLVDRYTPEVVARGITVDVIGVDMEQDHTLATKVHSYRRADDPASLQQAVADVFAEVVAADAAPTDQATGDAFAMLDPIPVELAGAMLKALAVSGNQPIGEQLAAPLADGPVIPGPQQGAEPPPKRSLPWWVWVIIALVVVLTRTRSAKRKRRSRR